MLSQFVGIFQTMRDAIESDNLQKVKALVRQRDENKNTPYDIDINGYGLSINGYTPLMHAAKLGRFTIVEFLIKMRAEIKSDLIIGTTRKTALDLALDSGHKDVAQILFIEFIISFSNNESKLRSLVGKYRHYNFDLNALSVNKKKAWEIAADNYHWNAVHFLFQVNKNYLHENKYVPSYIEELKLFVQKITKSGYADLIQEFWKTIIKDKDGEFEISSRKIELIKILFDSAIEKDIPKKIMTEELIIVQNLVSAYDTYNEGRITLGLSLPLIPLEETSTQVFRDLIVIKDFNAIAKIIVEQDLILVIKKENIVISDKTYKILSDLKDIFIDRLLFAIDTQYNNLARFNILKAFYPNKADSFSIIDNVLLNNQEWHMSIMHLSDHHRSLPLDVFLFIERINAFGSYESYKITSHSYDKYTDYELLLKSEYRKTIFGNMDYDCRTSYKPRYYVKTEKLPILKGFELIELESIIARDNDPYALFHNIIYGSIENWEEYVWLTKEYKKTQLLDLSEQSPDLSISRDAESARRDSWQIEMIEFKNSMEELKAKLQNINFDNFSKILDKEQCSQQQQKILNDLDAYQYSFYQALVLQLNAIYVATSSIHSQLISSNDSNQATTGKIGGFLKSISSHVPLVGVGVQMIGAIMVQVDQNDQKDSIARFATIVSDSGEMATLAREIAIILAPYSKALIIPEKGFSGIFGQAMDILSEALSDSEMTTQVVSSLRTLRATDVLNSFDVVKLAANSISGLKSRIQDVNEEVRKDVAASSLRTTQDKVKQYAERLIFGIEKSMEDNEISEGQAKAKDIAAFIIKLIFEEKVTSGDSRDIEIQIQNIVELISQQFDIHEPVIGSSAVTEVKMITSVSSEYDEFKKKATSDNSSLNSPDILSLASPLQMQIDRQADMDSSIQVNSAAIPKQCCIVSYMIGLYYDNLFLNEEALLVEVKQKHGAKIANKLIELGEDKDIAEQILLAVDELGVEKVLEIFFGNKVKTHEQDSHIATLPEFFSQTQDQQIIKVIAKLEDTIGKNALSQITGFYQYVSSALSNSPYKTSSAKVIKTMSDLIQNLQDALDLSVWYKNTDLNNQITVVLAQLDNVFYLLARGPMRVGFPPRPPHFDPDDYYVGFENGDNSINGNDGNDTYSEAVNLSFYYGLEYNSTFFDT